MRNIIESLYTMRQAGIKAKLRITSVRVEATATTANVTMEFGCLGFDELQSGLDGVQLMAAQTPPNASKTIAVTSLALVDRKIVTSAYQLGACDILRRSAGTKCEWLFKPSWHAGFLQTGMRLPDERIDSEGRRSGEPQMLFKPIYTAEKLTDLCADEQEHVYRFCNSKIIKVA